MGLGNTLIDQCTRRHGLVTRRHHAVASDGHRDITELRHIETFFDLRRRDIDHVALLQRLHIRVAVAKEDSTPGRESYVILNRPESGRVRLAYDGPP